jgi:Flp pilus assembly protein TadD
MRHFILLLAVALIALAASAQTDDVYSQIKPLEAAVNSGTATTPQQLDLARLYIQTGRYFEASRIAGRVLESAPNDAAAMKLRDDAAAGLRDVNDKRVAEAEAAAKRNGATDADRLALANAYFDAGSYGAAAEAYAHMPALDREARLRYARSLAWSGRLDAAERAYTQVRTEQTSPELDLEYGRLLSWMGAGRASIDTLRTAYNANPTEDNAIALANAMSWSGDREGAVKLLTDYNAAHAGATQATLLADQLRASPELRLERVNHLIESQPYNLALQVEKARLLYDAGRYSESLKTIAFIRDHSKQDIEGLADLERQAREKRNAELATLEERRKALDERSSMASSSANPDEILSLAKAYTAVEGYSQSERLYDRYLRLRPDDTEARLQYARVLSWDRKWDASERQYQTLLDQSPDRADVQFEYAQVLSYDADYSPAISRFRKLTDLSSNPRKHLYTDVPPRAYYNLGQIYRWFGWNDTAAAEQNRAIALDPGYMPARQELDLVRHVRPASNATGRFSYITDSEDFTMKRLDFDGEKWTSQRSAFDLSVGRHEFEHFGNSVFANVLSGGAAYRFDDRLTGRARAGMNFYDHGLGTRPFFGFGAEWLPSLESRASLDFNHYDLVYDVFALTSLGTPIGGTGVLSNNPLSINDLRAHYDYNTGAHLAWLGDVSYGGISDDNKRTAAHGLVTFRVLKAPFVALKLDGRYLSYDFRTNRYWSPTSYHSLAGVAQVGQTLRHFAWDFEVKAGRGYESGRTSDLRSYEGKVTVPISDSLDVIGNYGYGKSGRFNGVSPLNTDATDFTNYWQRHWYVGLRAKQLFGRGDRPSRNPYYFDNSAISTSSPVIPPLGEAH